MSRTRHHRRQREIKRGWDYGSRYKCNRGYASPKGTNAKNRADSERRQQDRALCQISMAEQTGGSDDLTLAYMAGIHDERDSQARAQQELVEALDRAISVLSSYTLLDGDAETRRELGEILDRYAGQHTANRQGDVCE